MDVTDSVEDLSCFEPRLLKIERERRRVGTATDVLLLGSSCLELWEHSATDLAPYQSFNAAVSGSKIGHQQTFIPRIASPMDPRAIVVYAGSNDMNGVPGGTATAEEVAAGVSTFLDSLTNPFPAIPIIYLSITRAPIKREFFDEIERANRLIESDIDRRIHVHFLDTDCALLAADNPDDSVFVEDGLHFSLAGYRVIAPLVVESLRRIGVQASTTPVA